ncbi:MAG: acyltransferase [Erysipelotrichaceae bacterium]|nr:acyltransferase [Erysipelotrichaceae bacterium]
MKKERKYYVDFLKTIGLLLIILAHVEPPWLLKFIRCFDVPFMVILSGILAGHSQTEINQFFSYFLKRFKRLVLPTWIWLILYFLIFAYKKMVYSLEYYINSFLLTRYGVGCVWVILIYLYCACMVPFLKELYKKNVKTAWIIVLLIYVLFEFAYHFKIGTKIRFIDTTFYYIVPYGLMTVLGLRYEYMNRKQKRLVIFLSTSVFIGAAVYYCLQTGSIQLPTIDKYPARLYFLSYSVMMSYLLLMICENRNWSIYKNRLVLFISEHSLWIYLWHMLYLWFYDYKALPQIFYLKWFTVAVVSTLTVFIQEKVLLFIQDKTGIRIPDFLMK